MMHIINIYAYTYNILYQTVGAGKLTYAIPQGITA